MEVQRGGFIQGGVAQWRLRRCPMLSGGHYLSIITSDIHMHIHAYRA